jgi:hypothetical protein
VRASCASAVSDRLRLFLSRPLRDADRPRLFGLTVAVIAGAALAFALLGDGGPSSVRTGSAGPSSTPSGAAGPPDAPGQPVPLPDAPSEEGRLPAGHQTSQEDVAQASRSARRFLAGYLPYSYGRRSARRVEGASAALMRRLASERPRVPAAIRRRQPRLLLVQSAGVGLTRADMLALVTDGTGRYTVALELERTMAGWIVTDVGS